MSILSWDDFEDDEPKQTAQAQQSTPIEPQKAPNPQVVSDARNEPTRVAAAQPAEPLKTEDQIQPIRWQEHLLP